MLSVLTDPTATPDVGYAQLPLVAGLGVTLEGAPPRVFTHVELSSARLENGELDVQLGAGLPLTRVRQRGNTAEVTTRDGAHVGREVQCETQLDYAEPRELLRSFLK